MRCRAFFLLVARTHRPAAVCACVRPSSLASVGAALKAKFWCALDLTVRAHGLMTFCHGHHRAKFGGTSVGTAERLRNVADIIEKTYRTKPVIAVVGDERDDQSRRNDQPASGGFGGGSDDGSPFRHELSLIEAVHVRAVEQAITGESLRAEVLHFVRDEIEKAPALSRCDPGDS